MTRDEISSELCAWNRHEECRQAFISETTAVRSHLDVGQKQHARYHLLRANAAVAQGLVWADICGITDAGWLDRAEEIMRLWEVCQ